MSVTISVQGIEWTARRYEGKIAFSFQSVAVFYNGQNKRFEAWSLGEMLYCSSSIAECLEVVTPCILDAFADQFIPSWDSVPTTEVIEPCEVQFEAA